MLNRTSRYVSQSSSKLSQNSFFTSKMAGRQPYIRIQWFLKRKEGMSSEDFHEYWEKVHADFALSLPGFKQIAKRYTQVSTNTLDVIDWLAHGS